MALTPIQREVVGLIARSRRASGESYLAGGAALNVSLGALRRSEDVDIFHDSEEAVQQTFGLDRTRLESAGLTVTVLRQWPSFVEVRVEREGKSTRLQWSLDSAYRFFPLVEHPELGLSLHPFDLATNKVLALVGRAVPRDWLDIIECDRRLQPLGYLVWAASGKDPGLNPAFILNQASRSARYTDLELNRVEFEGPRPTAAELSVAWHAALDEARQVIELLPELHVGECSLNAAGGLLTLKSEELASALQGGQVRFHAGSLHGAYPQIVQTQLAGQ